MTATTPEEWYASVDCGLGVTHIFEPHIDVFYRCNIWFVRGRERSLLMDSGLGVVSLVQQLPWLRAAPVLAVASHTHFDHIGNHHEFPERLCHPAESPILAAPTAHDTVADRYATVAMFERLPPGGFDPARYQVLPAPATRLISGGDVIDLGDRRFDVLHVPGHSPGSIALWEASTGLLLSGDAIYDGPLVDDAYHSNRTDYRESLERLRRLPVEVVHGGHYPSFGRTRFLELIDEYLAGRRTPGCPDAGMPQGPPSAG
jgi:glyoxylase-like metal-dependent hydrolase (beta-lactamase superfamily II)